MISKPCSFRARESSATHDVVLIGRGKCVVWHRWRSRNTVHPVGSSTMNIKRAVYKSFILSPSPFSNLKGCSSRTARVKVTAFSERGMIEHWNGFGKLCIALTINQSRDNDVSKHNIDLPNKTMEVLVEWLDFLSRYIFSFRDIEHGGRRRDGQE